VTRGQQTREEDRGAHILLGGGNDYEVAFQANTSHLWTVGADNHRDWGSIMQAGTSPTIVASF
jgi:hypothetical protein